MHEIIFGRKAIEGHVIDHKNSDGLDNRLLNLREITRSENGANRAKKEGTSSKYIGVSFCNNSYKAAICYKRKYINIGHFKNEKEAAKVRDIYSLFYYQKIAKLNRDENGDYILTKEEIDDILKNGIPKQYQKSKTERELPTSIHISGNKFNYYFRYNNVPYTKSYYTLEESIEGLKIAKEKIEHEENLKRLEIENNVIRNSDGVPILYTRNKKKKINGEFLVDEIIWKKYIHLTWYQTNGYAHGYDDKFLDSLHRHVFKFFHGTIPKDKTVDHISRIKSDCRIQNLRLADASEQMQNTFKDKKSIFKYFGVHIHCGKFYTSMNKKGISYKKGPYKLLEDAALAYNDLVLEHYGKNGKMNIITTSNTTAKTLYHKDNLTIDDIKNIQTMADMITIFRVNKEWRIDGIMISRLTIADFDKCMNIAIKMKTKEMNTPKITLKIISKEEAQKIKEREVQIQIDHKKQLENKREKSKYMGVCVQKRTNKNHYSASLNYMNKTVHLGTYENEKEAARIRDIYSVFYNRENANLNLDNGNFLLTDQEIYDILNNGVSESILKFYENQNIANNFNDELIQKLKLKSDYHMSIKNKNDLKKYDGVKLYQGLFYGEILKDGKAIKKGPYRVLEEAARAYNELVDEHNMKKLKNIITTKNTTLELLFHKDNLTIERIKNIKNIQEMIAIFKINEDWKEEHKVCYYKIKTNTLHQYIDFAVKSKLEELKKINFISHQ